jgi:predicted ribosomally synthesized peptide with SipW-like signal peptide
MSAFSKPRHRASTPGDAVRTVLGTSCAIAAAVAVAVGLSGGSYALWVDSSTASPGAISSGSAGLSITQNVNPVLWGNLLAGESVRQAFTVTNTGTVPLALSGSAVTGTASVEVRFASGACPGSPLAGASATTTAASLGTLAAGAMSTVCLEVRLPAAAPLGTSANVAVSIAGTQV